MRYALYKCVVLVQVCSIYYNSDKPMENTPNKNEHARDRFKRLATLRTNAVLKRLKVLSNCANRQIYEYDEQDIDKIFIEIERKVKEAKAKFHFPKKKEFKL